MSDTVTTGSGLEQTRRHGYLLRLIGVRQVVMHARQPETRQPVDEPVVLGAGRETGAMNSST